MEPAEPESEASAPDAAAAANDTTATIPAPGQPDGDRGAEGEIPPPEDSAEDRPSWVDVRDSWVGDRPSDGGDRASGPELTFSEEEQAIEPPPRTVPPPLPPPAAVAVSARSDDVHVIVCRSDKLAPGIMMERLAASDYSAALRVAETILRDEPDDPDAHQAREICRSELSRTYAARLGHGARVPHIVACAEELRGVPLDAHAGLVLSLIDGRRTVDEIAAAGRVSPLDAMRTLSELFLDGFVVLFDPDAPAAP